MDPELRTARMTLRADTTFATDDPTFGIWRDRTDVADVQAYLRKLRAPRYHRNGSRDEP